MNGIVVLPIGSNPDTCPRCRTGRFGQNSPVRWHTELRGMCANGHFIAWAPDPVEAALIEIFATQEAS